jgi:predicted ATPase
VLESVRFIGYRCLKDVTLRLGPLTALVGPNASGKSTILRGLNPASPLDANDLRLRDAEYLKRAWNSKTASQHGEMTLKNRSYSGQVPTINIQPIQFDVSQLRSPNIAGEETRLQHSGANLTNVLASRPRKTQDEIARKLAKYVPAFSDVDVRPVGSGKGQQSLYFEDRWRPGLWYSPDQVSDGTMLMLGFIALGYQEDPPDLLTIEEPERGLHPYLLGELIEMLRKLSTGELGRKPIQVVMATHSAELLDHLSPEEARFLRRNPEDGSTEIIEAQTDTPDWRNAYKEYQQSLGNIWLSGSLGGVPRLPQ